MSEEYKYYLSVVRCNKQYCKLIRAFDLRNRRVWNTGNTNI